MATTPMAPEAAPQAEISALGRITGVLFSPGATFADIARKPSWLAPILILTVLGLGVAFTMNKRIDWKDYIRKQIESSPRASQIPPERMPQIVEQQASWSPRIAYAFGCFGAILATLWYTLWFWLGIKVVGGSDTKFGTAFGITAHAQLPGLIAAPLIIVILLLKGYGETDPEHMLATSAASFLGSDAPKWLTALAGSFELFWFWTVYLLAVGYNAANPKKVSVGKALGIIIGVWMLGVFIKVAMTAAFS